MKPYGIDKKYGCWFDYTRFHRSRRQGVSAHRSKATKRRVKKTLKIRARRWELENIYWTKT